MKGVWVADSFNALRVLWVSFRVSGCPLPSLDVLLAPTAGPCDVSCEDHLQAPGMTAGNIRGERVPGITVPPEPVAHDCQLGSVKAPLPCLKSGQTRGIIYTLELPPETLLVFFSYIALLPPLPDLFFSGALLSLITCL